MRSFKDSLVYWMLLSPARQYVIDKLKAPLLEAIVKLATKYPEPTRKNCLHPNTLLLLDAEDRFVKCERNKGRDALFRAIWRVFIVEYEHDKYYRERINWVLKWILGSNWDYFELPLTHWDE